MRSQVRWSVAAVFAGLLAVPVLAQPPFRISITDIMQQGVDTPLLLASKRVREELKLTDAQESKIHRIVRDAYDKYPRQIGKAQKAARENIDKALPDLLSGDQTKRLQQIKLQVNGLVPFTQPEVQQKLKLTDKQKEEMQIIIDDLKKDIHKTIENAGNLREKVQAVGKVPQLRKEAVQRAVAKLSDEQKKTWNEMIGDTFEFPIDMMRSTMMAP